MGFNFRVKTLAMPKRLIFAGCAGSGKDFLRDGFNEAGLVCDVSLTTRPARDGETPGYTYKYLTDEEFQAVEDAGGLYENVSFNGWRYGTARESWKTSDVFIMTPSGLSQVSPEDRADSLVVYLDIPEDVRRKRIAKRNDADKVDRRIEADRKDFENFEDFDMRVCDPYFDREKLVTTLRNALA